MANFMTYYLSIRRAIFSSLKIIFPLVSYHWRHENKPKTKGLVYRLAALALIFLPSLLQV